VKNEALEWWVLHASVMAIIALIQRAMEITEGYEAEEKKSPYLQHEKICLTAVRLEGLSGGWIHFGELAAKSTPCPCTSGDL